MRAMPATMRGFRETLAFGWFCFASSLRRVWQLFDTKLIVSGNHNHNPVIGAPQYVAVKPMKKRTKVKKTRKYGSKNRIADRKSISKPCIIACN